MGPERGSIGEHHLTSASEISADMHAFSSSILHTSLSRDLLVFILPVDQAEKTDENVRFAKWHRRCNLKSKT
jgi:hypothetical protein